MKLKALVGALALAASATLVSAQQSATPERGESADSSDPFDFAASTLPRAEAGAWLALFDPQQSAQGLLSVEVQRLFARARSLYGAGDYPGAVGALHQALIEAPDLPPALQLLGTTFFRVQRYGDARECFERFLEHAPGELWRTQALGHCYYSLGLYEEARDHYGKVLDARPPQAPDGALTEARRGLALAFMRLGETDTAIEHLGAVVAERPDHADAWTWIGQIHYEELRFEEALAALETARKLHPHEPRPWFLLARVYEELDEGEKSAAARQRWQDLDRVTQEIRSVEARLELEPRSYDLALQLVELQKSIGNRAGVRRALSRLLVAKPANMRELEVRIYTLETLVRAKDLEGAGEAAAALEQACPEDPETWKALQSYYARVGDSAGEIRAGERFLRLRNR